MMMNRTFFIFYISGDKSINSVNKSIEGSLSLAKNENDINKRSFLHIPEVCSNLLYLKKSGS